MPTSAFHPNGTLFAVCGNGASLYRAPSRLGPWTRVTSLSRAQYWEDLTLWFDARGHFPHHQPRVLAGTLFCRPDAARTTPAGLLSAVNSQPLGPWRSSCREGACSQCKTTVGRNGCYTALQPLKLKLKV